MAIIIDIKVKPSAGKQEIKIDKQGRIVCSLKSVPEKGRANAELVAFIARLCKIPIDDVTLIAGAKSKNKRIKIESSLSPEKISEMLGLIRQLAMFN